MPEALISSTTSSSPGSGSGKSRNSTLRLPANTTPFMATSRNGAPRLRPKSTTESRSREGPRTARASAGSAKPWRSGAAPGTVSCALRCQGVQHEPIEPNAPVSGPLSPEEVCRELAEAIARTEELGQAILTNLHDAERELEDMRQGPAFRSRPEP